MRKNEIYTHEGKIIRILLVREDRCLVIDCNSNFMPVWKPIEALSGYSVMKDEDLYVSKGFEPVEDDMISPERKKEMYERYTLIAPVLSFIGDETTRSHVINLISKENNISKQSIRNYLKQYLIFQNIQILLPKEREYAAELTNDQKNMRWSLNKFFYSFSQSCNPCSDIHR